MTVDAQRLAADEIYRDTERWGFHSTDDPLVRYLRDRRLKIALNILAQHGVSPSGQTALVVCGGIGGEGNFLRQRGFSNVTVSDISERALNSCKELFPDLATALANAEALPFTDESFDVVVVQDGLHHLPRPAQGLIEMLRVSRRAVVVLEPHQSMVGRLIGTQWEVHGDAVNYVFRWDERILSSVAYSYTVRRDLIIACRRLWDHPGVMSSLVARLPGRFRLPGARAAYGLLTPLGFGGNAMVAVLVKPKVLAPPPPTRVARRPRFAAGGEGGNDARGRLRVPRRAR
jgi:ubiquinone/menaquinone biosynthesis C-methylase UbiE